MTSAISRAHRWIGAPVRRLDRLSYRSSDSSTHACFSSWDCCGAPAPCFRYIDRDLCLAHGPTLERMQTAKLLSTDGVVTGPQHGRGRRVTADELMLLRGLSIGYEDVTVQYIRTRRASLDETVTFIQD